NLMVAFTKLHSKRILLIFDYGRPRLYRLLNPENFILLASEKKSRTSIESLRKDILGLYVTVFAEHQKS
ncbi:MAG: hypothetical protein QXL67_05290, partial [Candidatus Bathyarchaeia archaeon]